MNRRLLVLNVILLALLVWGGRDLRRRWQDARLREAEVLARAPKAAVIAAPPSPAPVAPAPAVEYIDVAQKTLFSADRNPNIEIQVEPPKPEPPVPAMPAYFGQMAINKPVILFSIGGGPQKGYLVGDEVGEFKLLAFDREHVTLGWNGKELQRELRTLAPKEETVRKAANGNATNASASTVSNSKSTKTNAPAAARNTPTPAGAKVTTLGGTSSIQSNAKNEEIFGPPLGSGRACVPGDDSPAGTVKNGYKKVIIQSLMGGCFWEPTK